MSQGNHALLFFAGVMLILGLTAGCSGGGTANVGDNHNPALTNFQVYFPDQVAAGMIVYFDVNATDADGDTLTYGLTAPVGQVLAASPERPNRLRWQAPAVTTDTTVPLNITVEDGHGGQLTDAVDVEVLAPVAGNSAPEITSFTISANPLTSGQSAELAFTATDADGDFPIGWYYYQPFLGDIDVYGSPKTFTAPTVTVETEVVITIFVLDGFGNLDTADLTVTVQP